MKRLIQRMLRYLLRLFDGGVHAVQMAGASVFGSFRVAAQASGSGGGLAGSLASGGLGALARLGLAALVVGGLGVVPFVAGDSAFGIDLPGRDGGGDGVVAGASATPRPTSRPATPTPSPRTLTPSPTASPSPTPTPAPTAAPTAPPTTRPPTPIPVTPPPEVPPLADYCIYDKGIPQPSGTATDYADYAEQWFQVTNNYRAGFGLLPLDRDSRLDAAAREHAQFVVLRQWQDVYGGDERIHCDDRSRDEVNRAFDAGYPFVVIAENVAWGDVGLPIQDTFNNACGPRDASPRCPWNEDPAGEVNPEDGRSIAFHKTGVACYTRPDLQLFACAQVLAE